LPSPAAQPAPEAYSQFMEKFTAIKVRLLNEIHKTIIGQDEVIELLLAALLAADNQLGNRSRRERSSTDANIPLSVGIQAISLGAGGRSGGAHTLEEWFDPAGRELGLQRIALTVLAVAGLEP